MMLVLPFLMLPALLLGYRLGRWAGARGAAAAGGLFCAALAITLALILVRQSPLMEQYLLWWEGYIYTRDLLHLPFLAMLLGLAGGRLDMRSWKALRMLYLLLVVFALYTMRWAGYAYKYAPLAGGRDAFGIVANSLADTTGAACCATVLGYFGLTVSEGDMAVLTLTRPFEDASPLGVAWALSFMLAGADGEVRIVRPDWDGLAEAPGVVFMRRGRFTSSAMVFYGANADSVLLGDPQGEGGLVCLAREEFVAAWTGLLVRIDMPPFQRVTFDRRPLWL